jgi:hypothetical protein
MQGGLELTDATTRALDAMSQGFLDAFTAVEAVKRGLTAFACTPTVLSTCTFTGKLRAEGVAASDAPQRKAFSYVVYDKRLELSMLGAMQADTEFRVDAADDPDEGAAAGKTRKRPRPEKKAFDNQLCFRQGTRSLKLFVTGTVHVTGCSSPMAFVSLVNDFVEFLEAEGFAPDDVTGYTLLEFTPVLINVGFALEPRYGPGIVKIRPQALAASIAASAPLPQLPAPMASGHVEYETERHPSVKLPIFLDTAATKKMTISFCQTGTVSVQAAREPAHIAAAFTYACALLEAAAVHALRPCPEELLRKTTAKQGFRVCHGYLGAHFDACFNAAPGNSMLR